jgi:fatty acid desaturase
VIPERRDQRERNLRVIAIRGGVYLGVAIFAPKAALLYAIAIMAMITVLRFMDSLQHDYGYHLTLFSKEPSQHKGDLEWEQEHTFSNPQSFDHEWLNWLTLNFGYHNAHHAKPITPGYRLPGLHRELFGNDPANVIPLGPQLRVFHRHRVARVLPDAAAEVSGEAPWGRGFLAAARRGAVIGGNAASFLTPF